RNNVGEFYRDIFIYDIKTGQTERLTNSARLQFPSWSPDGKTIAAIMNNDGTQNLVLLDPDLPDSIDQLTEFSAGETISTPTW
ncbi:hypothetical protein GWN26_04735, partial [Candidatus Saccharibacteria bacterium]|nr:hypothetical protein [Candidatus Saccharibacteria bacterium]